MFATGRGIVLETYIVPVCTYAAAEHAAELTASFGTAFFINDWGVFLTAAHVIREAKQFADANHQMIGLCVKSGTMENMASPIQLVEAAPEPYDVAIGVVPHSTRSPLFISRNDVGVGLDIATYGYPLSATVGQGAAQGEPLWINGRMLRGSVQRLAKPRDIHIGAHPDSIELSYLLSPGMSGAPIVSVVDGAVLGVGVGSFRSELIDHSVTEVDDAGRLFKETRLRIEQYGLAHDLRGLLNWQPLAFKNCSLLEIATLSVEEFDNRD